MPNTGCGCKFVTNTWYGCNTVINKKNIENENRLGFYVAYDTLCYCGTPLLKSTNKSRYEYLYNFKCNKFSDLGFIIKTF